MVRLRRGGRDETTRIVDDDSDMLTHADIRSAFRVLLGREPDDEGLDFFGAQVGLWSPQDLAPYIAHSEEFLLSPMRTTFAGGASNTVRLVDIGGFQLATPSEDIAVGDLLAAGPDEYEPHVRSVFEDVVKPGATVVDGGANIGYFTFVAVGLAGDTGHVIAVEAMAANVDLLRLSAAINGIGSERLRIVHAALGDSDGYVAMRAVAGSNAISSSLEEILAGDQGIDGAEVPTTARIERLDDIVGETRVDVLKLDIEGAEALAIHGGVEMLRRDQPTIIMEYSPMLLTQVSGSEGPSILDELASFGYEMRVLAAGERPGPVIDTAGITATVSSSNLDHLDLLITSK